MRKYKSAFVFGKFLPLTLGHKFLIDSALKNSDKVTLVICSIKSEPIPGELRYSWAKEIYKDEDRIDVKHCSEELPQYPEEHIDFWNIWIDVAKRYCPSDIDVLFTSELYGETYSKYLGIHHVLVDLERQNVPVSGTKVRSNPFKEWDFIPNIVKPHYVKKIAIMGPESVGKSIMTKRLSNYFNTNYVQEYGRTYVEQGNPITQESFYDIMSTHNKHILEAKKTSNKLLFVDTEAIITRVFFDLYFPNADVDIKNNLDNLLVKMEDIDFYILLNTDVESINDGTREFLHKREEHYQIIHNELLNRNKKFIIISGSDYDKRFEDCIGFINSLY